MKLSENVSEMSFRDNFSRNINSSQKSFRSHNKNMAKTQPSFSVMGQTMSKSKNKFQRWYSRPQDEINPFSPGKMQHRSGYRTALNVLTAEEFQKLKA